MLAQSWLSICHGVPAAAPKLLSAPSEGDVKFGLIAARAEIGVNADVVNWDFIPQSAINQLTLVPSNPVYGLNATGGALAFEMKNGYTYHAIEGELSGGPYGRAVSVRTSRWPNDATRLHNRPTASYCASPHH